VRQAQGACRCASPPVLQNSAPTPSRWLVWAGENFNDIASEQQIVDQLPAPGRQGFATDAPLIPMRGYHDVRGV
jgi:hypothetical protein